MQRILGDPTIKLFISIIGITVVFIILRELQHIFIPFIISYFLYFVFSPLNKILYNKKIPQPIIILLNVITTVFIITLVYQVLMESLINLSEKLPFYIQKLNIFVSKSAVSIGIQDNFWTDFRILKIIERYDISELVGSLFNSTLSVVSTLFFVLFFFIFISSGHDKILNAIKKRFKDDNSINSDEKEKLTVEKKIKDMTEQVQRYVAAKIAINLSTSLLIGVTLYIFNVDFFFVWGLLFFLLGFLPVIGSVIAIGFPVLTVLLQFESFSYAFLVLIILIIIINISGNLIEPKILGERLGINPLIILISLLIWGYIWGIAGMLLSVPLTAIVKILLSGSDSRNVKLIKDLISN